MYRRSPVLILALLLIPGIVFAWTDVSHMDGKYPSPGGNWSCIDSSLGYGGVESDSTTPDSSTSLRLTYQAGFSQGGYAAKCWNMPPQGALQEYWVQFYIKYSSNYQFHSVGNKMVYFMADSASGGYRRNYWIGGLSRRLVFQNQGASTGNYFSNTGYDPILQPGQWYKITHHFKVNTPGLANGSFEIWVNDILVMSHSGVQVIGPDDTGINEWQIAPVFGGLTNPPTYKKETDYQYYDYTIFSTSPISGGTLPSPVTKPPNPPSNILIR